VISDDQESSHEDVATPSQFLTGIASLDDIPLRIWAPQLLDRFAEILKNATVPEPMTDETAEAMQGRLEEIKDWFDRHVPTSYLQNREFARIQELERKARKYDQLVQNATVRAGCLDLPKSPAELPLPKTKPSRNLQTTNPVSHEQVNPLDLLQSPLFTKALETAIVKVLSDNGVDVRQSGGAQSATLQRSNPLRQPLGAPSSPSPSPKIPTPADPTKRGWSHVTLLYGTSNWAQFEQVFMQEGQIFQWTEQEYKYQLLRRLAGEATEFAEHVANLHEITWPEMWNLARTWYGKAQETSYFQRQFETLQRKPKWSYSQFSSLMKAHARRAKPERDLDIIDAMVFDRLVAYAREVDKSIYDAIVRTKPQTVGELVAVADQWFEDYPEGDPTGRFLYKPRVFARQTHIGAVTTPKTPQPGGMSRPRGWSSPDWKNMTKGPSTERNTSRPLKSREPFPRSNTARTPCPICHQAFHWIDECPSATPHQIQQSRAFWASRGIPIIPNEKSSHATENDKAHLNYLQPLQGSRGGNKN
jgi:hypothetical protein